MSPKSYMNVFVSSTVTDLAGYRASASHAILQVGMHPIMMEDWSPQDQPAIDKIMGELATCDVLVGIYARRYGYIPPGSAVSITEMEFDEATLRGIERLCFRLAPAYPWDAGHIEGPPGDALLEQFLTTKIDRALLRGEFTTPESLAALIILALGEFKLRQLPHTIYPAQVTQFLRRDTRKIFERLRDLERRETCQRLLACQSPNQELWLAALLRDLDTLWVLCLDSVVHPTVAARASDFLRSLRHYQHRAEQTVITAHRPLKGRDLTVLLKRHTILFNTLDQYRIPLVIDAPQWAAVLADARALWGDTIRFNAW